MNGSGTIDILTRVEGHGRVELLRNGSKIVGARLHLHESPRLFEALLIGRHMEEVADIACRICSICSTAHKVAALQAIEQAQKATVSHQTNLLRQLAIQGGQIESHALHIFCLALPDYLGAGGFPGLAAVAPQQMQQGLRIKAFGNLIQETVGGRAIHPFNLLIGGVGTVPQPEQLQRLNEELEEIGDDLTNTIRFISALSESLPPLPAANFCAVSGGPPLFGDRLTTSAGDSVSAGEAAVWLNEQIEQHTNAKFSRFDGKRVFIVGPLARLNLTIPTEYTEQLIGAPVTAALLARAVELQQAAQRAMELIRQLLEEGIHKEKPISFTAAAGEGASLIEAPRGILLHSYRFNHNGICSDADIITPTAINQAAIEAALQRLVTAMDGAGYDQVKSACERLVRCFDPCFSCAVH